MLILIYNNASSVLSSMEKEKEGDSVMSLLPWNQILFYYSIFSR